jgi:hypothetical protein
MSLKFWAQTEIIEGNQAIFWYLFLIDNISGTVNDFLNTFIHSANFKENCLPFMVKKNRGENDRFLKHAFNADALDIEDFKILKKDELFNFFDNYSREGSWGDDRADFLIIKKKLNDLIEKETTDHFYLISKEWFDKGSKLLNDNSDIYLYYFLIIWLDSDKKVVNICELNYD